jgi:phosphate transport system permease protein
MDRLTKTVITVGGIGTIVAVSTVGVFLLWVVLPLFMSPKLTGTSSGSGVKPADEAPAFWGVDEYEALGWAFYPSGRMRLFRLGDGEEIFDRPLVEGRKPTAWSFSSDSGLLLVGFDDGWLQSFELRWRAAFLDAGEVSDQVLSLEPGDKTAWEDGVIEKTPEGQYRFQRLIVSEGAGLSLSTEPVQALDHVGDAASLKAVALVGDGNGKSTFLRVRGSRNMLTQKVSLRKQALALPALDNPPAYFKLNGIGGTLYAIWTDGRLFRYRLDGEGAPMLAELSDVLPEPDREITALQFLLGRSTLLVGDDEGEVRGWFTVRPSEDQAEEDVGQDGMRTVLAKHFGSEPGKPVRVLASASRTRTFLAGHDGGVIRMIYAVSETQIGRLHDFFADEDLLRGAVFSPKGNGLYVMSSDRLYHWKIGEGYPEASLRSLFLPVWYEGYAEPQFMWQSSSASDESEPKLSLVPLIFGTLKATIYSMLFGAPIALLAAIFTSEFLAPRAKAKVKPVIELMASLPSVVLGFLAALVFAPVIEQAVTSILGMFMIIPAIFVLGGLIWQLLPYRLTVRLGEMRIIFMLLLFPVAIWISLLVGPFIERWLFSGDIKMWLHGLHSDPVTGDAFGGIFIAILPLTALLVTFAAPRTLDVFARRWTRSMARRPAAIWSLAKFGILSAVALLISYAAAEILSKAGVDVRKPLPGLGSIMDTYDQRNALVVGFVMGFAIIPIIYTIAEDALSTVPGHLRSASLGAGATQWQTAMRIVIPTAMSGLFSALMIGLGRAVGETMIVLMALGNTPVMNANLFEGARTLSANIAVELPEAVRNSAHYRTLFLSALVLFILTFIVNTLAESVRLRFRKRAYHL